MARNKTVGYTPAVARRGTRPLLITAGVVLVLALIAGGAFALGRMTAPTGGEGAGAGSAAGNMPFRSGIPVPDRQSKEGAVTAALNYQIAGFRVSAGTVPAADAAAVLLTKDATPAARDALVAPNVEAAELDKERTSYGPMSAVVHSYSDQKAVVLVWGVAATSSKSEPEPAGVQDWGRSTITLVWDGAQWRVANQEFTDGPWPARSTERMAESEGEFAFRFSETGQWWGYVPSP
jgi:hypothetical protein